MITQDSTEKDIKEIHESTLRLKTSQPFFYGQLNMKQSVSDGSYYIPLAGSSNTKIKVTFTANTQDNPFCMFYVTAGIGGNFERHDVLSVSLDNTQDSIVSSNKTVSGYYYLSFAYAVNGETAQITAYAIASDNGTVTVEVA